MYSYSPYFASFFSTFSSLLSNILSSSSFSFFRVILRFVVLLPNFRSVHHSFPSSYHPSLHRPSPLLPDIILFITPSSSPYAPPVTVFLFLLRSSLYRLSLSSLVILFVRENYRYVFTFTKYYIKSGKPILLSCVEYLLFCSKIK